MLRCLLQRSFNPMSLNHVTGAFVPCSAHAAPRNTPLRQGPDSIVAQPKFIIVDPDFARQRDLACALAGLGLSHSAADPREIAELWPARCQIFVHDEGDRLGELHAWLERGGMRFPLIPYSSAPSIERVVEALHSYGAVGYLDWPCAHDRLCRTLALGADKAEEIFRRNEAYARSRALVEVLTPREQEVLAGIFNGCTGKEIARDLGLSPRTVETYRANIFTKLDVRNAVEAVRLLAEKLPELDAEDLRYTRLAGVEGGGLKAHAPTSARHQVNHFSGAWRPRSPPFQNLDFEMYIFPASQSRAR